MELIRTGSLLHDLGRFRCKPGTKDSYKHGVEGARMIREELSDERLARICERHSGGGISKEDIEQQGLDLPKKDLLPETREEKIICYADKLVPGNKIIDIQKTITRFRNEIGERAANRIKALHEEIQNYLNRKQVS